MVDILAITNNIYFIQKLLEESTFQGLNLNLIGISTNKFEVENILHTITPSIIFLDKDIEKACDKTFLKDYKNIIIRLTYSNSLNIISPNVLKEIKLLVNDNDFDKKKIKIVNELEYIGYKFKYKGTHYLVDTILQMYSKQNSMVDNLQTNIYPIIAKKYNKSIHNIKSSINKATECMYYECDANRLKSYFKFTDDTKPTVKQVVFTVINKI